MSGADTSTPRLYRCAFPVPHSPNGPWDSLCVYPCVTPEGLCWVDGYMGDQRTSVCLDRERATALRDHLTALLEAT